MSFKDLNAALPEIMNDKVLPAEIYAKKEVVPEPVEQPAQNGPADESDEVPDAAAELGAAFDDAFASSSEDDGPPPKKAEAPVAETKVEEEKEEA